MCDNDGNISLRKRVQNFANNFIIVTHVYND